MSESPKDLALIIGSRLDGEEVPEEMIHDGENGELGDDPDKGCDQHEEMEQSAVSSLIDAINSKDPRTAKEALCDFLDLRGMR